MMLWSLTGGCASFQIASTAPLFFSSVICYYFPHFTYKSLAYAIVNIMSIYSKNMFTCAKRFTLRLPDFFPNIYGIRSSCSQLGISFRTTHELTTKKVRNQQLELVDSAKINHTEDGFRFLAKPVFCADRTHRLPLRARKFKQKCWKFRTSGLIRFQKSFATLSWRQ